MRQNQKISFSKFMISLAEVCRGKIYANSTQKTPVQKTVGGKLRPFGVGAMSTVPEFDRVAFSLQNPGDISDPFQTQYGWHIVRLERKIPLPPLSELSTTLRPRVARDERTQISRQALMKKLEKDFLFQENLEIKTKIFALADTSLTKGKWTLPVGFSGSKEILFSMKSKSVTAQDFLKYVQQNQKITSLTPNQYIEQLYSAYVEKSNK
jgi:peptidyl-prolyl cis-trans isomerase SurA